MKVGYACVSTQDQQLHLQVDALQTAGCTEEEHQLTEGTPELSDVARLSPLLYEHVNMLGRYDFTLPKRVAAGELRPLRDPDNWQEQLAEFP